MNKKTFAAAYKKVVECVDPKADSANKIKDTKFSNTMKAYSHVINEDVTATDVMEFVKKVRGAATKKQHTDFLDGVIDFVKKNDFWSPEQKNDVEAIAKVYAVDGFDAKGIKAGKPATAVATPASATTVVPEFKKF